MNPEIMDAEGDKAAAERATISDVYFQAVLMDPVSVSKFRFFEDTSITTGSDRYVLLAEDQQPAIFYTIGSLTHMSVTAAGAVKNRRFQAKIDEYSARLKIENEKDQATTEKGFEKLVQMLKETKMACQNISVSSGLVESRKRFKLEDITVKVSNYSNNTIYFNRKVATRTKPPRDNGTSPDFMNVFPRQGQDYPALRYPTGWFLNPLIPVTDDQKVDLNSEDIELPRRATVYFEMRQGCYNFEGKEGHIRQIVLIPSITAIKIHPPAPKELTIAQKAKRRRLSC